MLNTTNAYMHTWRGARSAPWAWDSWPSRPTLGLGLVAERRREDDGFDWALGDTDGTRAGRGRDRTDANWVRCRSSFLLS